MSDKSIEKEKLFDGATQQCIGLFDPGPLSKKATPNRFYKFAHIFGFCFWSQWSEPEEERGGVFTGLCGEVSLYQSRSCTICNKAQRRQCNE